MRIRHLTIHNYRSIKHVDIEVPNMLVLLGPNNHGKSNILGALEFGLSTSAKPVRDDLCAFREPDEQCLWVEMTFAELTPQEQKTFQKYLRTDKTIRIRKTASFDDAGNVTVGYRAYVQEPEQWWLKESAYERLKTKEMVEAEAKKVPALLKILEGGSRITKQRIQAFQETFIQEHRNELSFSEVLEEGPLLGAKNVGGGILPEFYLVPAVRDLSDETKIRGTAFFGRLLQRAVQEMTERDPRFVDLHNRMQQLISELNDRTQRPGEQPSQLAQLESLLSGELITWGVGVSIQVRPPQIEKILELGTELHLDDGLRTLAERKGHGLQRAVIFALLRAWAKVLRLTVATAAEAAETARKASESSYFAIEEPELFLHPHAQRQLAAALVDLSSAAEHQVFVCTHSTHFVDLDRYRCIAICRKPGASAGTEIRQCKQDLFEGQDAEDRKRRLHMAMWINPDRGELFFAKKVILVEGETEKVILPYLAKQLGCLDSDVSVIDCGSKYNLRLYIAILNAFHIPYCVVHDEDPLPDAVPAEWTNEKVEQCRRLFDENARIQAKVDTSLGSVEVLKPDFEGVAGVSRAQGEKKGKAIAALEHFAAMEPEEFPKPLCDAVRKAYLANIPEVVG
ncbi:ATP-dependent nuclease [Nitrospira sp. Kam-Ns4a]